MVKLPDYTALGTRLPQAVSQMPNFPSRDAAADSMGRFGQVLTEVGNYWNKKNDQDTDAIDLPKAESMLDAGNIKTDNFFETDSDFATQPQRAEAMFRQNLYSSAANIRNPRTRQIFIESRAGTQARKTDGINDFSRGRMKEQDRVTANDTMKRFHDIYVDPKSKPEEKAKAMADMQHTLEIGLKATTFTPAEADQMKSTFIDNAPWEKGRLAIRADSRSYVRGPVTIADIPKEGTAFLNLIARLESGNRNVLNGGKESVRGNIHPNRIGAGGTSTAAGYFQMIGSTWNRAADALGIPRDQFTPENQAKAAWWNAQYVYKDKTNGKFDLLTDLQSGSAAALARVKRVLGGPDKQHGEWTALQDIKDGPFAQEISGGNVTFDFGDSDDPLAGAPEDVQNLPPDQRQDLIDLIKSEQAKDNVDLRSGIEVATQNAPAAIQNTGGYDGHIPTMSEFQQAYGSQEGAQRFDSFVATMDVASKIYGFQRASNEEIAQTIEAATPTSSGDDAALQAKKHAALVAAGQATFEARAADPAGYVMRAFPNVDLAFDDARNATDADDKAKKTQEAMTAMSVAQTKLGIPALDQVLVPKMDMANAVDRFKDTTLDPVDRLGPISGLMMATKDPAQKKRIFDQAVRAGLPDMTAAAFAAMERNEPGAAQRLFAAGMTNVSELGGKSSETQNDINARLQLNLFAPGKAGDVIYGVSGSEAGDTQELERDAKMMSNYIHLRLREGKTLDQATEMLAKDMWGDVKTEVDHGFKMVLDAGDDAEEYKAALNTLLPKIRASVEATHKLPIGEELDKRRESGQLAIDQGKIDVNTERVMNEGYFWSHNGGFVFIDAYSGLAIGDYEGDALFFSKDEVSKMIGAQKAATVERAEEVAATPTRAVRAGPEATNPTVPEFVQQAAPEAAPAEPAEPQRATLTSPEAKKALVDREVKRQKEMGLLGRIGDTLGIGSAGYTEDEAKYLEDFFGGVGINR